MLCRAVSTVRRYFGQLQCAGCRPGKCCCLEREGGCGESGYLPRITKQATTEREGAMDVKALRARAGFVGSAYEELWSSCGRHPPTAFDAFFSNAIDTCYSVNNSASINKSELFGRRCYREVRASSQWSRRVWRSICYGPDV